MTREEAQAIIDEALKDMTGPQRVYIVGIVRELARRNRKEEQNENENAENGSR